MYAKNLNKKLEIKLYHNSKREKIMHFNKKELSSNSNEKRI
jgi:hypothetical protein